MNGGNINILKLQDENKSQNFYTKLEWKENSFGMTIFQENSSVWCANVTKNDLEKLAEERSTNLDDYYIAIKDYFLEANEDISFNVKQCNNANTGNTEFRIKRRVSGRTILFFSAKLIELKFENEIFQLIDALLEKNKAILIDLENCKKKEIKLGKEKQMHQDKLIEFVKLKADWEQEMYSNFLIVLNEKKKQIQFLTNLLTHKNINPDDMQVDEATTAKSPTSSPIHPSKMETISESSSSSSENETDQENDDEDNAIEVYPTPSTSKQSLQIEEDVTPILCLPKLTKKSKENNLSQKIKHTLDSTSKIFSQDVQSTQEVDTQEPYLSTQERLDRL